jgi:hypothetical protein
MRTQLTLQEKKKGKRGRVGTLFYFLTQGINKIYVNTRAHAGVNPPEYKGASLNCKILRKR